MTIRHDYQYWLSEEGWEVIRRLRLTHALSHPGDRMTLYVKDDAKCPCGLNHWIPTTYFERGHQKALLTRSFMALSDAPKTGLISEEAKNEKWVVVIQSMRTSKWTIIPVPELDKHILRREQIQYG